MKSSLDTNHCINDFELAIRFFVWAGDSLPPWKKISARWGVSRATAFRWRAALKAVRGIE